MAELTLGSLFDGIGGFPLAGICQGFTPLWASEIEPFPIEVTKIRFPNMRHVGDITKLKGADLPPVDVICGGSPCQDLSIASNNRQGLKGARSGLFMEQIRLTKELRKEDANRGRATIAIRPRYFFWENVPGAFSSADGKDFGAVLEETVRIVDGGLSLPRPPSGVWKSAGCIMGTEFSLAWRVLDAQHWPRTPQRRRRIFLVADFGGQTAPQILFESYSVFGNTPQICETWQRAAAHVKSGTGDTSWAERAIAFACNQRDEVRNLHDRSAALCASQSNKQQTFIAQPSCLNAWDTQQSRIFTEDSLAPTLAGADKGGGRNPAGLIFTAEEKMPVLCLNDQGGNQMCVTENIAGTLRAQEHGHQPLLFENYGIDCRYKGPLKVAPTLARRSGSGGNNLPLVSQALFEGHGKDARYNGPLDVAPTLSSAYGNGGGNIPLAMDVPHVFSLDSVASNSMKSKNPTSGCRETDLARTIDTASPCPSKNQGGLAIVQEAYCIAGNIIDRQDQNGGNGCGFQPDISYCLTATDIHAVCEPAVFGQHQFGNYKEGVTTLRANGGDSGGGSENLVATVECSAQRKLVRRLTPLECERLMGYPDGWTLIPGCSDSARYRALGNSVAIPCVEYILRSIAYFLRKAQEEQEGKNG